MVENRNIYWSRILLAFLIALFLLVSGILLGYLGSKIIQGASVSVLDSTKDEIANLETLNLLDSAYSCSSSILDIATNRLGYLTDLIHNMETQNGKSSSEVLELKKLYSIVEIRHMLLLKERAAKCNVSYSIILYFYSNTDECKGQTDNVAFVLAYLRNKYSNVRVYSFDINLDSDVVSVLKSNYNASGCYTVVVNDKKLGNVNEANDVEKYFK